MKIHPGFKNLFATLAVSAALIQSGFAATSANVATGDWNTAGTWSTGLPVDGATVGIGNNSTVTFQAGDAWTGGGWTQGLIIGYGAWAVANWNVVNPGNGILNVTGGTLDTGYLALGEAVDATKTGTLNISSGAVTVSQDMLLGWTGVGSSINVSGGTFTVSAGAFTTGIGYGAAAALNVSGSGTATFNRAFTFANNSTLTISGNGTMTTTVDHVYSSGTVNVNSGTLNEAGYFSGAALNVAGGTVNLNRAGGAHLSISSSTTNTLSAGALNNTGDLYLGFNAGGNGNLNQSAGTMLVTGVFYVGGNGGSGHFNQTGGSLTVNGLALGVAANGSSLNVDGSVTAPNVFIGADSTLGGDGTITITGGGNLDLNANAKFVFSLTKTLTVNGGTVSFGNFDMTDLVGLDNTVADGIYTLIDGTATFDFTNVANFGAGNAYDLGSGKSAYFQAGSFDVVVIPEPSTAALLGMGSIGFLLMLRRRRVLEA